MMGYYASNGWQGWMFMAMWVWPLLVALAIWGLVALTRDRTAIPAKASADDPVEILKRRFAKGDLTQDEYLEATAILENGRRRAVHR
jgi:uncharacterized membrane protein